MREILFRGKRKDNGEWLHGGFFHQEEDDIKKEDFYIIGGSLSDVGCAYPVKYETVGQYTGLTDKNGTKIFEGDIVNYSDLGVAQIHWDNPYVCGFVIQGKKMNRPMLTIYPEFAEVIGNIHDNPERC